MLGKLGPLELAVIAGLALLFFGPKRLPELGRGIGKSIREFRNAGKELLNVRDEVQDGVQGVTRDVNEALRK